MNVYENCPVLESTRFYLRLVEEKDCEDLLNVYSDPKAVPLFNGDNCNGDDFHYTTRQRMEEAIRFWIWSYKNGWFVRWSVLEKSSGTAVGTIELCRGDRGILRLDLRSDFEETTVLSELLELIVPPAYDWFGCDCVITKARPAGTARLRALKAFGFSPAQPVTGHDGTRYGDYYQRML